MRWTNSCATLDEGAVADMADTFGKENVSSPISKMALHTIGKRKALPGRRRQIIGAQNRHVVAYLTQAGKLGI